VIPLLTRAEARALDRDAIEWLGLPSLLLMENAGRGAFEAALFAFPDALSRVVIVGGTGQNGGDGWVVARHLYNHGYVPRSFLLGEREHVSGDALVNLRVLDQLGLAPQVIAGDDLAPLVSALAQARLVVDAMFGTGLDRPLAGIHARAVELINASAAKVLALDLPSGVDADTGALLGSTVRADLTVTFAAHKCGLHQYPAAAECGRIRCASIGVPVPHDALNGLLEASDVAAFVPSRAGDAHKGTAGHVLAIAGAPGRTGAAALCGLGALRGGAGLCTLATRGAARAALDGKVIELMTAELPESAEAALEQCLELSGGKQSAVLGPGIGVDEGSRVLARQLALALPLPTVLDADALTALGGDYGVLRSAAAPRVLTPHPGEAARLLATSSADVQANRFDAARRIAAHAGCVVVLKGARTLIADPGGRVRVCPTGTPAMAVAGTGDVLSGLTAALLAQADAFDAASAAVYLHGLAGELAAHGDRGLLASELAAALPAALAQCRGATA
jgi:ADP-dependent NAD(P)H-hydrate dehydratase / NAD(P)H-hydrate epimerase